MPKSSGHRFNHNVRHRFRTLAMDSERARFLRHLQGAPHDLRPLFFKPSGCVLYATGFQHKQGMVGFYIVLVAALMPLQMIGVSMAPAQAATQVAPGSLSDRCRAEAGTGCSREVGEGAETGSGPR